MAIYTINDYRNAIRDYIERIKRYKNAEMLIVWDVRADESKDPTLLSQRAYGSRHHVDVILIACGVSGVWEPLPMKRIVLPKLEAVLALRKQYLREG